MVDESDVTLTLVSRDSKSTSSLRRHATKCWGAKIVSQADKANDLGVAREAIRGVELRDRSITAAFERTGKGRITYSHHPRTNAETP
jgi:hypothetical protein